MSSSLSRMFRLPVHSSTVTNVNASWGELGVPKLISRIDLVNRVTEYLLLLQTQINSGSLNEEQIYTLKSYNTEMINEGWKSKTMDAIISCINKPGMRDLDLNGITMKIDVCLTMYFHPGDLVVILQCGVGFPPPHYDINVDPMLSIFGKFIEDTMRETSSEYQISPTHRTRRYDFYLREPLSDGWVQILKNKCKTFLNEFSVGEKRWIHRNEASVFLEEGNENIYKLSYQMNAPCYVSWPD